MVQDENHEALQPALDNDKNGEATHLALHAKFIEHSDAVTACRLARQAAKKNPTFVLWSEQFVYRVNRTLGASL